MDVKEYERRCGEMHRSWAELAKEATKQTECYRFGRNLLLQHDCEVVGDLPLDVQEAFADLMRELKPDGWLEQEWARLEKLSADLLPHIVPISGPVN